jgi:hypothetical protein
MLVIGHLRWSRQARQALFNICSIWGVSKILVWSYNFKGVLAGRFSHLWPTLYNNGFKDPLFIDLLINFTMLPYSTYFYTGSIHVQYVALQAYFSHPRLVIYFTFFPHSPITNETWTAKGKTSNSTSNPQNVWWKQFLLSQTGMHWLCIWETFLQGHILSTVGDLNSHPPFSGLYCINVYHKTTYNVVNSFSIPSSLHKFSIPKWPFQKHEKMSSIH